MLYARSMLPDSSAAPTHVNTKSFFIVCFYIRLILGYKHTKKNAKSLKSAGRTIVRPANPGIYGRAFKAISEP